MVTTLFEWNRENRSLVEPRACHISEFFRYALKRKSKHIVPFLYSVNNSYHYYIKIAKSKRSSLD
jgi:hypothetical protein